MRLSLSFGTEPRSGARRTGDESKEKGENGRVGNGEERVGTGVDEEGRGGGGRRKKRMRWQKSVGLVFAPSQQGTGQRGL